MLEVLIHEAEQFRVVAAFWVSVHGPVLVGARSVEKENKNKTIKIKIDIR